MIDKKLFEGAKIVVARITESKDYIGRVQVIQVECPDEVMAQTMNLVIAAPTLLLENQSLVELVGVQDELIRRFLHNSFVEGEKVALFENIAALKKTLGLE